MIPLYIVIGFVCILFGICIWIFEETKHRQKIVDVHEADTAALKQSAEAEKLSDQYTQNALQKPDWAEAKKEMTNDPASF